MSKKPKAPKFTFRKEPRETGLLAVGHPWQSVRIKHNKLRVGMIYAPCWSTKDGKWGISLMVKSGDGFKWTHLSRRFDDEQSAREFLQDRAEQIFKQFDLYHIEDD